MRSQNFHSYILYDWTENMYDTIIPVIEVLDESMNMLEIGSAPPQREESIWIPPEIEYLEKKWKGELTEVSY